MRKHVLFGIVWLMGVEQKADVDWMKLRAQLEGLGVNGYCSDDVEPSEDGGWYLPVKIDEAEIVLGGMEVGPPGKRKWIFIFDPGKHDEHRDAGVAALKRRLEEVADAEENLGRDFMVITPGSDKSGPMVQEAVVKAGIEPTAAMVATRIKDPVLIELAVQSEDCPIWERYVSITSPDGKLLVLDKEQVDEISEIWESGGVIVLADDVLSNGGTRNAIAEVVARACGISAEELFESKRFYQVFVARESGDLSKFVQEKNEKCAVGIPEVEVADLPVAR